MSLLPRLTWGDGTCSSKFRLGPPDDIVANSRWWADITALMVAAALKDEAKMAEVTSAN